MARGAIPLVFVWMLLASSNTFAAGPFGVIHANLWQGGAFTDDNTGAFSHCSATYPYQGGNLLTLAQRGGGDWIIGFGNPSWNMTQGETVPFDITVDGQAQFYLTGTVASSKQVISILPVKVLENLDVIGAYYHYNQQQYVSGVGICANTGAQGQCAGTQDMWSAVVRRGSRLRAWFAQGRRHASGQQRRDRSTTPSNLRLDQ